MVLFTCFGLAQTGQRPNIILLLTDDLAYLDMDERSPNNPGAAFMPNLKQLVINEGLTFTKAFVTNTVCCPSRVSTLTGQYSHNNQVRGNGYPLGGFQKFYEVGGEKSTLATWFQAAGYRTIFLGKYLNWYPLPPPGGAVSQSYVPPGWTDWHGWTDDNGFYKYYDYDLIENGIRSRYGIGPDNYLTDVLTRKALEAIDAANGPFFMYLAPIAPHQPATPADRHKSLFSDLRARRGPAFNEQDVSDKPWPYRDTPVRTNVQISEIDELHRNRMRTLMAVDEMIKAVVDKLQQKGMLQNTYIVFTSDNGFHMGEHRLEIGKNTAYEEDIQVPLYIRGPGVRRGQQDQIVLNNDLAPTFADLAGVAIPASHVVDGRSLRPLLSATAPESPWRTSFLIWTQAPEFLGAVRTLTPSINTLFAQYNVREGQLISNLNREFYDLNTDPYEMQNSFDTASRVVLGQHANRLASLRNCAGLSCVAAENAVVGPPQISQNGIVNAASYAPTVAPGGLISIFGIDLARRISAAEQLPLPTTLGGVSVNSNGRALPLLFVSPTQINAQLPVEASAGSSPIVVTTEAGDTAPAIAATTAAAPGIFVFGANHAIVQNPDLSLNTDNNPAPNGSVVVMYLTGIGPVDNPVATGQPTPIGVLSRSQYPVTASVGGQPAEVQFAGLAPGIVGVMQLNLLLPQMTPGTHPVMVTINGTGSNAARIAIR